MNNETVNIGDTSRNHYTFYNALALLSHNNKDREFGTVIAESKNKLIIVDDEVIREHVSNPQGKNRLLMKLHVADELNNIVFSSAIFVIIAS